MKLARLGVPAAAAFFFLLTVAGARAQTTTIYLCIGSTSSNFGASQYASCPASKATLVTSLSFGAQLTGVAGTGTGTNPTFVPGALTFVHSTDATTAPFGRGLMSGQPMADPIAIGINMKAASGTTQNVTILLQAPIVTNLTTATTGGTPAESVSLYYTQITVIDNSVSPPKTFTWKTK
ncbi:MAG: type VI secretion system tube protein Hcp [Terracidiphilus sp.]